MSELIRIGPLFLTPEQLHRALAEDMTMSQAAKMIEEDKRKSESPFMRNVEEADHDVDGS